MISANIIISFVLFKEGAQQTCWQIFETGSSGGVRDGILSRIEILFTTQSTKHLFWITYAQEYIENILEHVHP